jgi:choline dehydrogenase-like flavoprotein
MNNGEAIGAIWVPNSLDPAGETRSFARTAYYDPAKTRPNFHLIAGYKVRDILFSDDLTATGITFQARNTTNSTIMTVMAKKEVILAAGAAHSPQILQRSGVGPKELLKSAGIKQKVDLPGVGANLQDHANCLMLWACEYLNDFAVTCVKC